MPNDGNSLAHTKWNGKYHIAFDPKYRRKVFFGEKKRERSTNTGNREFWCRGYHVDAAGKNAKKIEEFIKKQLREDKLGEQMTMFGKEDPYTGGKEQTHADGRSFMRLLGRGWYSRAVPRT